MFRRQTVRRLSGSSLNQWQGWMIISTRRAPTVMVRTVGVGLLPDGGHSSREAGCARAVGVATTRRKGRLLAPHQMIPKPMNVRPATIMILLIAA
ncbi:MAG TPA: hypothetical protein VNK70_01450 [Candidatus Paceibacterota bacterium]|nr:hypothetical protein [Candidatus Paceibacterota bacterium]